MKPAYPVVYCFIVTIRPNGEESILRYAFSTDDEAEAAKEAASRLIGIAQIREIHTFPGEGRKWRAGAAVEEVGA